jgi:hypothetical protein
MKTTTIENINHDNEITKSGYQERRFKEINLEVFSNGVHYIANKLFMYFRAFKKGYYIILSTNKGTLISGDFNSIQADSEFLYLSRQDDSVKEGIPVTIDFFNYTVHDENIKDISIA